MTARNSYLLRTYGITEDDYLRILEHQGGVCAVCSNPPPEGKNLNVDHDHRSGLVRGLLCTACNYDLIGRRRDPELFFAAGRYLSEPPAVEVLGEHAAPKRKRRRKVGSRAGRP